MQLLGSRYSRRSPADPSSKSESNHCCTMEPACTAIRATNPGQAPELSCSDPPTAAGSEFQFSYVRHLSRAGHENGTERLMTRRPAIFFDRGPGASSVRRDYSPPPASSAERRLV